MILTLSDDCIRYWNASEIPWSNVMICNFIGLHAFTHSKFSYNEDIIDVTEISTIITETSLIDYDDLESYSTHENEPIVKTSSVIGSIINDQKIPSFASLNELKIEKTVNLITSVFDMTNCLSNCSNNGKCKFKNNQFSCECLSHFSGATCQVDTRPCSSNPCLNNATCIDEIESKKYNCECVNDPETNSQIYYGQNCQFKIDVCENETCSGNGNCKDFENRPQCECFYLFNGTRCEFESLEMVGIKKVMTITSIVAICVLAILC
ncbi:unnamed protein product [Brachionus calyciflorus]|uniref:EGF-like domain-containing protein n=1 Tax=Brachionus calyciflorus TaxID=104777 RepID=A0A814DY77_9BILA|nr:unnamed protein product [Brachionus calyciflorus]